MKCAVLRYFFPVGLLRAVALVFSASLWLVLGEEFIASNEGLYILTVS